MSTKIDKKENLDPAKAAVVTYRQTCIELYEELKKEIEAVCDTNFIGDASNGYQEFFKALVPALTTNLTDEAGSITSMLAQILDAVAQMNDDVDPQLGNANKNAATGNTPAPAAQ